ncbi:MAG: 16S rRNA (guanine(527)-N(7))-methyltransferase RsmG [Clostridia bacterium]|jgi:16S rRNA (guanine527-N7)-methyltransferase
MKDLLKGIYEQLGITFKEEDYEKFNEYSALLIEWNQKFNLTGITQIRDIYLKHYADSLMLFKGIEGTRSLIDVGSGAGFPGIPLKIAGYAHKVVLLEANGKKAAFLDHVIDKLELDQIFICQDRAEIAGRGDIYRERFDVAVARAVAPLNVLLEYCIPFVKKDGLFIAMKTDDSEIESSKNAMKQLSADIYKTHIQTIPFTDINRCNIYFKKTRNTLPRYPRADGMPKKKPL